MPRDLTGLGRFPPIPRYPPFAFYTSVRVGDPELLAKIMQVDPYFITQDNGAGAPLHFAVTYCQLDMAHHLLNLGASINQSDARGFTPLHRAAHLAHLNGYMELYEYLLSRGADPTLKTLDYDPYLAPGRKLPVDVAVDDDNIRGQLLALERRYASVPKAPVPHPDIGDWWTLYDYGQDVLAGWAADYKHPYPEERKRAHDAEEKRRRRAARRATRDAALSALAAGRPLPPPPPPGSSGGTGSDGGGGAGGGGSGGGGAVRSAGGSAAGGGVGLRPVVAGAPPGVVFLFPGQGSQAVGMIKESAKLPAVQAMLQTAKKVLGYDLLELCTNGPKERLDDTAFCQPALLTANLAAVEALRASDGAAAADVAAAAAGLSLGEYAALVFAGAMSYEDALKVVKVRGEAMAAAGKVGGRPHGMLSVVGLADEDLERICAEAVGQQGGDTVCRIANYLFPTGRVVSGHEDALELVQEAAVAKGALRATRLQVSGAFHTPLMEPARAALMQVLSEVELRAPRIPVLSNVTAQPFPSDPTELRALLGRQLVEPVRWEACLTALLSTGHSRLYELGPGQQIKSMVRRIDNSAWKAFSNVSA